MNTDSASPTPSGSTMRVLAYLTEPRTMAEVVAHFGPEPTWPSAVRNCCAKRWAENIVAKRGGPGIFKITGLGKVRLAREIAAQRTPRPAAGTWTLTAPDGRAWQAESPIKCVSAELLERVPPAVAMARIRVALGLK